MASASYNLSLINDDYDFIKKNSSSIIANADNIGLNTEAISDNDIEISTNMNVI